MNVAELIRREGYLRGLQPTTIKTYIGCVNKFLRVYKKEPWVVTKKDFENWVLQQQKWGRSSNTINTHIHALKFFYENVLHKKITVNINLVKNRKRIPVFLTKEEVKELFSTLDILNNKKYVLMIKFLYSTGMRVSELLNLKVRDLEFDNNYGWVRDGKGGKDRMFIISSKLKNELIKYIKLESISENNLLFTNRHSKKYSVETIRVILKELAKMSGIKKNVHPHALRHSFATHLVENGYGIGDVRQLLGHNSVQTTMIYLHTASAGLINIKSPFDEL